mmetsp:Transcript_21019/g.45826  ORF Transcript_21019/g.45826 Transcript_21019/m.45826 type:complete len:520 (+) Transcript_21019:79-1638(+)
MAPPNAETSSAANGGSGDNCNGASSIRRRRMDLQKTPVKGSPSAQADSSTAAPMVNDTMAKMVDEKIVYEFGGPTGVAVLMVLFPALMCYLYICLMGHSGVLVSPFNEQFWREGWPAVMPNAYAAKLYLGFTVWQAFMSRFLPGVLVKGLPVPSLNNQQLVYNCNGISSWYLDLVLLFVVHYNGIWNLGDIVDNMGAIMMVSVIWSNVVSVITYAAAFVTKTCHRMSGNHFYDFFMGAPLNPRFCGIDLKMWSEIRIPWKILFLVSLSAAVKEHDVNVAAAVAKGLPTTFDFMGMELPIIMTSAPLLFMLLAHTLYVNACMKGEECIPTTWDIFYEKWGWMLIYWNLSGVPFSYCYSTVYLLNKSLDGEAVVHPKWYQTALFGALLLAYYVWDTANSQKNRFRMQERGTYVERNTFPQLPWGTLENPTYLKTKRGTKLLTGGWWGIARKIHYTADLVMALSWGLVTGAGSGIPYFYFFFFTTVLIHRVSRDIELCKEKYGKDWDDYCKIVPYIFVPGIF